MLCPSPGQTIRNARNKAAAPTGGCLIVYLLFLLFCIAIIFIMYYSNHIF
jgi:Na+/proline symporter